MARIRVKLNGARSALDDGRDVLFVYIGWSTAYDGDELVYGSHGWLSENAEDCAEMAAFVKQRGFFRCGIGTGDVGADAMDVVFVAKRPGTRTRRAVGLYSNAGTELWNGGDTPNDWRGAVTRDAVLFPDHARFTLGAWPGSSGLRRWARRDGVVEHADLLVDYRRALKLAEDVRRGAVDHAVDDAEIAGFEGQLRELFVKHRKRESELRNAKVRRALRENRGRLRCEVPGCGFDFLEVYGPLGAGYAQVHHKKGLAAAPVGGTRVGLADLAVVCANCHAMIHRYGACRSLREVQPRSRRRVG